MKWLLISCVLINYSFGLIHANVEPSEEDDCEINYINQYILERVCILKMFNPNDLNDEMRTTLIDYSGNNSAVHEFADKYCSIFHQVLQCILIVNDLNEECLKSGEVATRRQRYDIFLALLNYMCANSSAVAIQFLENNGLETVYGNNNFTKCFRSFDGVANIDLKTLGPTTELCVAADKSLKCYTDLVQNHSNQTLVGIANEIHLVYRQALKCDP